MFYKKKKEKFNNTYIKAVKGTFQKKKNIQSKYLCDLRFKLMTKNGGNSL